MKTIVKTLIIIGIGLVFINCSCPPLDLSKEGIDQEWASSSQVFIGTVTSIQKTDTTFCIRVVETFKGGYSGGEIYMVSLRQMGPKAKKN